MFMHGSSPVIQSLEPYPVDRPISGMPSDGGRRMHLITGGIGAHHAIRKYSHVEAPLSGNVWVLSVAGEVATALNTLNGLAATGRGMALSPAAAWQEIRGKLHVHLPTNAVCNPSFIMMHVQIENLGDLFLPFTICLLPRLCASLELRISPTTRQTLQPILSLVSLPNANHLPPNPQLRHLSPHFPC